MGQPAFPDLVRAAGFLLILGCAAADASRPPGLVARLDVKPAPGGVTLTLQLRNASRSPISIVAVERWEEFTPDLILEGTHAEALLRIERRSGSAPKGFALLSTHFHSSSPQRRLILLRPGESRSYPRALWLPPGEYEARATYMGMALEDVEAQPLATEPLRFRVEGPISR